MPLGIGSFLLYAQGPRTDLEVAYLNATINAATVTLTSGETSPGFNVFRTASGVYRVVFPPCKLCKIVAALSPVVAGGGRAVRVLAGFDPTLSVPAAGLVLATGANAVVEISTDGTANGAAADPSAAANELELLFLLGF